MFELKIFKSEQFGLIRTMVDDKTQEVVFNGNDVASALGYTKAANAIRDYCKGVIDLVTPTNGGPQKMKYLSEPDLYRLIMASKLPERPSVQLHPPWQFAREWPRGSQIAQVLTHGCDGRRYACRRGGPRGRWHGGGYGRRCGGRCRRKCGGR